MASPSWAQSSVTVYGMLDEGVELVTGIASNSSTTHGWRVGAGTGASRWGFKGKEDLGGGLKAVFTLEAGIGVDTGGLSQGGRIFGRQAYVGLSGGFGALTLGRQYTMRYHGMLDADLFGAGAQGLGTLDSGVPNARADNAIAYRGEIGAVSGGVQFSFGRDAASGNNASATNCPGEAADASQCREWSVMAKYDGGTWGATGSYERQHGGTAATFGGLTAPDLTDSRAMLTAYLHLKSAKWAVGWVRRVNEGITTPVSQMSWVTGSVPMTEQLLVDTMLAQLRYEHSPNKALLATLRGNYILSKRTSVYLSGSHLRDSGALTLPATTNAPSSAALPGGSQTSVIAGIRHSF